MNTPKLKLILPEHRQAVIAALDHLQAQRAEMNRQANRPATNQQSPAKRVGKMKG